MYNTTNTNAKTGTLEQRVKNGRARNNTEPVNWPKLNGKIQQMKQLKLRTENKNERNAVKYTNGLYNRFTPEELQRLHTRTQRFSIDCYVALVVSYSVSLSWISENVIVCVFFLNRCVGSNTTIIDIIAIPDNYNPFHIF